MLLHTSEESETRTLTRVGIALAVVLAVVVTSYLVIKPFDGGSQNDISITIETPYVGEGVTTGTSLVMHGIRVGKVTDVLSHPGGGVRLKTVLDARATAGLTDTMKIDFRPINYFGVTGVNLKAGAGGQLLRDGDHVIATPEGNFALQALLTRLGQITTGVVTPQLIHVIEWGTRYTDALNPLVETMLIATNAVAKIQTVSTEQLLNNTAGISVAFPGFVNSLVQAGDNFIVANNYQQISLRDISEDYWQNRVIPVVDEAQYSLFAAVGRVVSNHMNDLLPVTDLVKALTDVAPPLLRPEDTAQFLVEMRTRLEKMYGGTPEQRALQVRIVLDSLPGIAAPLDAIGGP